MAKFGSWIANAGAAHVAGESAHGARSPAANAFARRRMSFMCAMRIVHGARAARRKLGARRTNRL